MRWFDGATTVVGDSHFSVLVLGFPLCWMSS